MKIPAVWIAFVFLSISAKTWAQPELVEPDASGVIPQAHVALTNTHVVDVRTGDILTDALVVVRDGRIEAGTSEPRLDVSVVAMDGTIFEGRLVHGDNPVCVTFELVILPVAA